MGLWYGVEIGHFFRLRLVHALNFYLLVRLEGRSHEDPLLLLSTDEDEAVMADRLALLRWLWWVWMPWSTKEAAEDTEEALEAVEHWEGLGEDLWWPRWEEGEAGGRWWWWWLSTGEEGYSLITFMVDPSLFHHYCRTRSGHIFSSPYRRHPVSPPSVGEIRGCCITFPSLKGSAAGLWTRRLLDEGGGKRMCLESRSPGT